MLDLLLKKHTIILASGSPRRQQFLKELGISFEVQLKNIEETYPPHLRGKEIPEYLAALKASAYSNLKPNDILITGDTVVLYENSLLGKPKNSNEATSMLESLSGKTHKVISSICIKSVQKQVVCSDTTLVTFKKLSKNEIEFYLNNYNPYDKAGGYGIQDWIGKIGITHIEGSYNTVMGLPTHLLYDELLTFIK